jgi:hypothetical protein
MKLTDELKGMLLLIFVATLFFFDPDTSGVNFVLMFAALFGSGAFYGIHYQKMREKP